MKKGLELHKFDELTNRKVQKNEQSIIRKIRVICVIRGSLYRDSVIKPFQQQLLLPSLPHFQYRHQFHPNQHASFQR